MKTLINSKSPSSNPLQMFSSGDFNRENAYVNPPVVLKIHTGRRLGRVNFPASNEGWTVDTEENRPMTERKLVQILLRGFRTNPEN